MQEHERTHIVTIRLKRLDCRSALGCARARSAGRDGLPVERNGERDPRTELGPQWREMERKSAQVVFRSACL